MKVSTECSEMLLGYRQKWEIWQARKILFARSAAWRHLCRQHSNSRVSLLLKKP